MPHNVFLHSALVQSRKIDPKRKSRVQEALNYYLIESSVALFISFMITLFVTTVFAKGFYGTEKANNMGLVNAGQYRFYGGRLLPLLTLVSKEKIMGDFKIGRVVQRIAWTVAALVMIINGYLLLDFFVSQVDGFLFGVTVCVWTTAYVAFIVYLISHSNFISSSWSSSSIELPKRVTVTNS